MQTGKIWLSLLTLFATSVAVPAMAAEDTGTATATGTGESKINIEDAQDKANKTSGQDVDELITNNKMRAETGSKSKWSLSSALNYSGGSVDKPLAEERPNIADATATNPKSLLEGTVSAKYNLSTQNSLQAGVGVRWVTPLNGKPHNYNGDRTDASNPYLTYQRLFKAAGFQNVMQVTPTAITNSNLVAEGGVATLGWSLESLYEVGHSGLSLGLYFFAQGGVFNKTGPLGDPNDKANFIPDLRTEQSDYAGGLDPYAEYAINDKVNLRTVANLWNYEHIRSEKRFSSYRWDKVNQSVGVGFSITRDIFLYPNLQFLPDNIRADRTNVALNTNINMF